MIYYCKNRSKPDSNAYVEGTYKDLIEQYANVNKVLYAKPPMTRVNERKSVNKLYFTSNDFNSDVA